MARSAWTQQTVEKLPYMRSGTESQSHSLSSHFALAAKSVRYIARYLAPDFPVAVFNVRTMVRHNKLRPLTLICVSVKYSQHQS